MEKELENQTDLKAKKNKLSILIIVFVCFIILTVVLGYVLFFKQFDETSYNENFSQEDYIQETDNPIISILPNEKNESEKTEESLDIDTTLVNSENSQVSENISSPTVPENSTNATPSTNQNVNNNKDTSSNTDINNNDSTGSTNGSDGTSDTTNNPSSGTENSVPPSPPLKPNYTTTSELLPEAKIARNQYSDMISQVVKNTNSYRQEANINSIDGIANRNNLSINENLCVAACVRAIEMAYSSKFSHTRPNGEAFYSILNEMNISYMAAGENIAKGYSTANSVCERWKNSKGHYENIISSDFSQIGIGVFEHEGTYYWVQIFN